jgi:hypothetical protein
VVVGDIMGWGGEGRCVRLNMRSRWMRQPLRWRDGV